MADSSDKRDPKPPAAPPRRTIRHVQPLGMRVLVRLAPEDTRTATGLFLPQGVSKEQEDALYGEVVEVARARREDDAAIGENVSGIPAHAWVLFPRAAGHRVPWDHDLRLVETKDVLAIVDEVDYEQAH